MIVVESTPAVGSRVRDLRSLPKAHLHIHFEAAIRPSTLRDLSTQLGIPVPVVGNVSDWESFTREYAACLSVLVSSENIERVVDEIVADAAADGAVAIEIATTPMFYAEVYGSSALAIEAITAAARAAGERHGIWVGIIIAIMRDLDQALATEYAELAVRYAERGVIGLGLHSEERGYPASGFVSQFELAARAGLLVVPHSGDLAGPESIWDTIDSLAVDRIQHGVRAIEDPTLVGAIAERGICLDVCPTSNITTGVYPDAASHPLPALISAGIECSINADDPTMFGVGLLDEYEFCRTGFGFDDGVLASCAAASIRHSAAPETVKGPALAEIERWLSRSSTTPSS